MSPRHHTTTPGRHRHAGVHAGAYQPIREYDVAPARADVEPKPIEPLLLATHSAPVPAMHSAPVLAEAGSIVFRSGIATVRPGPNDSLLAALNGARASSASAVGRRLSAGRIGRKKDIADAIIALLRNGFMTGTVLHADGGHRLVLGRG